MKKISLVVLTGILVVALSQISVAQGVERNSATVDPSGQEVRIPDQALNAPVFRLIVPTDSPALTKISLKNKGCSIVRELNDAVAASCPGGIKIENAVLDEVLSTMDLEADQQINADDVWNLGFTGDGVTVGILDTGIDTDNPELLDSIAGGKGFGYSSYEDDNGHGTHVSGIITANGSNGLAKGVAPDAKVWMGKVCSSSGACYTSDIAAGIEYIVKGEDGLVNTADDPINIISISLGGSGTGKANCDRNNYLAQKVNWAVNNGVTVAAAAGNKSGTVASPACASKAIAVGAVAKNDARASWSGSGLALDIMAPGVSIFSTLPGGAYAYWSGTSMATPHIAGVVALLKQKNSSATDTQIKNALYGTAKDLGRLGWDKYYGWGRVDVLSAFQVITP